MNVANVAAFRECIPEMAGSSDGVRRGANMWTDGRLKARLERCFYP